MTSLRERLGEGEGRKRLINDACQVLDQEVADKGGLSGLAIKGAYTVVKGIKLATVYKFTKIENDTTIDQQTREFGVWGEYRF